MVVRLPGLTLSLFVAVSGGLFAQVTITNSSPLPDALLNNPYSVQFTVSSTGSYSWSISGTPPDLSLDSKSGVLSGIPHTLGTFSFSITATPNSVGGNFLPITKLFQLTVAPIIVIATASPLPDGDVNAPYATQLRSQGGKFPFAWSVISGSLPPGLQLGFETAVISGTPTLAGAFKFTVSVQDTSQNIGTKEYTLTINPPLSITTASPLPGGVVGVNYSQTLTATGGSPPYVFFVGTPPPGLSITPSGVLIGYPTQSGTFSFNVAVTDNIKVSVTKAFQVTITAGTSLLVAAPLSLSFTAAANGDSPDSQSIIVLAAGTSQTTFRATPLGAGSDPTPAWLKVSPASGSTPGRVAVSVDQGSMPAGNYSGRVRIEDGSQVPADVAVTLQVVAKAPSLDVSPNLLQFFGAAQTSASVEQIVVLRNNGGGSPLQYSTQVLNASIWITSVSPGSGQIQRNSPVYVHVRINPQGLQLGKYRDVLRVVTAAGNVDIPVTLFITRNGPMLSVSIVGLRFRARQGGGSSYTQTVKILNLGDPAATVNWTAAVTQGANFLSLGSTSGTATATKPGDLTVGLSASATQLAPGAYYGLIRISDSNSLNSTQYVMVVLDLADAGSPALPDPSPTGMFFTGPAGTQLQSQLLTINASSSSAVPFQLATSTSDGASWLAVSPAAGQSSGASSGSATVAVNTAGLAPGIYSGEISVGMLGSVRIVNVALVVQPAGTIAASAAGPEASCSASKLAIAQTGIANNFSVPAKWPATVTVQVNDDCGASVTNGSVAASFSNGDPPLSLRGDNVGSYSATWQPGFSSAQMQVTVRASSGALQPATVQLNGSISQNQAPVLAKNGTLHNLNPVVGGALAPGTVSQVFGSGLASATASPNVLPLATAFNGTIVLVGGFSAPLYFVSDGQVNIQLPTELDTYTPYTIIATANGAITLPDTIDIVPVVPGIAAFADGHIIAQHSDFTLVDAAHPAKPGEFLVMYLAGLGATNPAVASGQPSPSSEPFARITAAATVMVDAQTAPTVFSGLTPGFAGLYQINFQVPANARSGDLVLQVLQGGQTANTTRLPVSQ